LIGKILGGGILPQGTYGGQHRSDVARKKTQILGGGGGGKERGGY